MALKHTSLLANFKNWFNQCVTTITTYDKIIVKVINQFKLIQLTYFQNDFFRCNKYVQVQLKTFNCLIFNSGKYGLLFHMYGKKRQIVSNCCQCRCGQPVGTF